MNDTEILNEIIELCKLQLDILNKIIYRIKLYRNAISDYDKLIYRVVWVNDTYKVVTPQEWHSMDLSERASMDVVSCGETEKSASEVKKLLSRMY